MQELNEQNDINCSQLSYSERVVLIEIRKKLLMLWKSAPELKDEQGMQFKCEELQKVYEATSCVDLDIPIGIYR